MLTMLCSADAPLRAQCLKSICDAADRSAQTRTFYVRRHGPAKTPGGGIEPVPAVIIEHQREVSIQRVEGGLIAAVRRCLNAQSGSLFRAALSGEQGSGLPSLPVASLARHDQPAAVQIDISCSSRLGVVLLWGDGSSPIVTPSLIE